LEPLYKLPAQPVVLICFCLKKTTGWPAEIKALAMNGKDNLLLIYVMRILVGEKSLHIPNENQ